MFYEMNYTVPQMSEQFGYSKQLVYKHLYDAGLKQRDRYTTFSQEQLDEKVAQLQTKFPNAGSVVSSRYPKAYSKIRN